MAWDLREMGSIREGREREGEQDKQLTPSRKGVNSNMEQEEEGKESQA
jgi:hypothetical protein